MALWPSFPQIWQGGRRGAPGELRWTGPRPRPRPREGPRPPRENEPHEQPYWQSCQYVDELLPDAEVDGLQM